MLKGHPLSTPLNADANSSAIDRRDVIKIGAAWAASACLPYPALASAWSGKLATFVSQQDGLRKPVATYIPSSAKRLCQLTGDYDPTGLPHLNDTLKWAISGTDMGCPVEFKDRLYFLFGDVPTTNPVDLDPVCYTLDGKISRDNIRLRCVTGTQGRFNPMTVDGSTMSTNETATGAFVHENRLYAFIVRGNSKPYSTLVSTGDPETSVNFTAHYDISDVHGKFWQIAPYVTRNAKWPGLPSHSGNGLLMWGQSGDSVYLAWVQLARGVPPLTAIRYYTADGTWSPDQAMAAPIFSTDNVTQISVAWLQGPRKWLFLYTKASVERPHESIVARLGADPWTWSDEITLFNPDRENAWGKYMHQPGHDELYKLSPPRSPLLHGYPYSPFLLNRYTTWDSSSRRIQVVYMMATFVPYQVMLMQATLQVE